MNVTAALDIIDRAVAAGWKISAGDAAFVDAYRSGAESFTPDETTNPYDRDEIAVAVVEISEDADVYLEAQDVAGRRTPAPIKLCTACGQPIEGHRSHAAPLPDWSGVDPEGW